MDHLFSKKAYKPMMMFEGPAFDSDRHIFELKLDGIRVLAYVDGLHTALIGRKGTDMTDLFPELAGLHSLIKGNAVLDGEIVCMREGRPDFSAVLRRAMKSNPAAIRLAAAEQPAELVAFDILYHAGQELIEQPLTERKAILSNALRQNTTVTTARFIEGKGKAFFDLVKKQRLEGIVAKKKTSTYRVGKRSKDWIKCKATNDEDVVIVGFTTKNEKPKDLILAQYDDAGNLVSRGKIYLGVSPSTQAAIEAFAKKNGTVQPLFPAPDAVWIEPELVGTVRYLEITPSGAMRAPVFKGLRPDKHPSECRYHP